MADHSERQIGLSWYNVSQGLMIRYTTIWFFAIRGSRLISARSRICAAGSTRQTRISITFLLILWYRTTHCIILIMSATIIWKNGILKTLASVTGAGLGNFWNTNRVKYHAAGINRGEFPPACGEALGGCILYVVPYICIITKQQANDDRYRRSLLFFIL